MKKPPKLSAQVKLTTIADSNKRGEYIRGFCYDTLFQAPKKLKRAFPGEIPRSLKLKGLQKYWILTLVSGNISDVTASRFVIVYHD